jgi:hypothetical protein
MAEPDSQAEEAASPAASSPERFIDEWPLYTRYVSRSFGPPKQVSRTCSNQKCMKETTWVLCSRTTLYQATN